MNYCLEIWRNKLRLICTNLFEDGLDFAIWTCESTIKCGIAFADCTFWVRAKTHDGGWNFVGVRVINLTNLQKSLKSPLETISLCDRFCRVLNKLTHLHRYRILSESSRQLLHVSSTTTESFRLPYFCLVLSSKFSNFWARRRSKIAFKQSNKITLLFCFGRNGSLSLVILLNFIHTQETLANFSTS